jgi:hypothetical protein
LVIEASPLRQVRREPHPRITAESPPNALARQRPCRQDQAVAAQRLDLEVRRPGGAGSDGDGLDHLAGERELVILVDGVPLLDEQWGGMGMDPDDLLSPDLPMLPPEDGSPVERLLQRCGCGVVGCGSLSMTIRRRGGSVIWSDPRDGDRPLGFGPIEFDAAQYEEAVRNAHGERPWETREERVARLVPYRFAQRRDGRPRSFDWASGRWAEGHVVVSFSDHRPNPRAGLPTGPRESDGRGGWWQGIEPAELHDQHLGQFPIPPGLDDDEVARAIARQIEQTRPADWPKPDTPWL